MSGYTPTTDEVREDFAYPWEGFKQDREGRLEAFDRWLNAERARVWDDAHGAPCDEWVVTDMCAKYHPNPYRKDQQ